MNAARVERQEDRVYFVAEDASRWRVHDVHFAKFRRRRMPLGHARANYRWFVAEDGTERCRLLGRDADRRLTSDVLGRQLAGSEYPARSDFDPKAHG